MPSIQSTVSATGGVIILTIGLSTGLDPNNSNITIERYTDSLSNPPVTIYIGPYGPVYIDLGDSLPSYLDVSTPYFYTVTDTMGSATTTAIVPSSTLEVFSNYLDKVLFRLFSAGFTSLALPQGFNKIRVLQAMPLTMGSDGTIFPFVVMNLDLEQQEDIQIGQAINTMTSEVNTIPLIVYRRYSIHILSQAARERDFYKDAGISIIYNILPVLNSIGNAVSIDFQAAQSQASEGIKMPGFYEAVIMLDITGQFNVASLNNDLPIIENISAVFTAEGVSSNVIISSGI